MNLLNEETAKDASLLLAALGEKQYSPEVILRAYERFEEAFGICDKKISENETSLDDLADIAATAKYTIAPDLEIIKKAAESIKKGDVDYCPQLVGASIITCTLVLNELKKGNGKAYER